VAAAQKDDGAGWIAGFIATLAALVTFSVFSRKRIGDVEDLREKSKNVTYRKGSLAGITKRTFRRGPGPATRKLDPKKVRGITLHQVGVRTVGKGAHKKMTAHVSVGNSSSDMGQVYWIHPFDTWLAASNGFNNDTLSLEVSGLYGKDSVVPDEVVDGAVRAIRFMVAQAKKDGITIDRIYAHRQSSAGRGADPGPDLWRRVALRSGLGTFPNETRGSGKTIPDHWLGLA
jgi:hypothetical protein